MVIEVYVVYTVRSKQDKQRPALKAFLPLDKYLGTSATNYGRSQHFPEQMRKYFDQVLHYSCWDGSLLGIGILSPAS